MAIDPATPPKFVVLPFDLANAVAVFLQAQPWGRVNGLLQRLDAEARPYVEEEPHASVNLAGIAAADTNPQRLPNGAKPRR